MNTKHFLLALATSIVYLGCQQNKVDTKAEEAAILKTDSTWSAMASQSKDVDNTVSYWSDDAVVMSPGEEPVKGKEALKKMVAGMNSIPGFSISWKSSDVHFSPDGQMAYMYGENMVSMNDSAGNKISIPGRGYTVWKKDVEGNWKCVVDIWNNPPAKK